MGEERSSSLIKNTIKPTASSTSKLSGKLQIIWPIKRGENARFLLMTSLMFCILFIQNLIRALKDSIVNTLVGTEVIAFLKFWGVLPASFLIAILYVKAVNIFKGDRIFYFIVSLFLLFFFTFAFYIFPNYETLHLSDETMQLLIKQHPHFKWFILLIGKWGFSLFYIICEVWPNLVVALLFWQFINQVTTVEQSSRFYGLFGLLGQTGLYISGQFLVNLPLISAYFIALLGLKASNSVVSVQVTLSLVIILGLLGLICFWVLTHKILPEDTKLTFKIKAKKISLQSSIKMIIESRYIRLIATLLISYGIAINLAEAPWKSIASQTYRNVENYAAFAGNYLSYNGICTVILVLVNVNVIRRFGWFTAAIITPIVVFTTGGIFFATSNFESLGVGIANLFLVSDPAIIFIIIGAAQNVLSKSTKYTFFDITKEMSYVPLDDELKAKGKAAVDVIATKVGKSASSFLQSMIFIIFPAATYQSISIYLMLVFVIICIFWFWAVSELSKEYEGLTQDKK